MTLSLRPMSAEDGMAKSFPGGEPTNDNEMFDVVDGYEPQTVRMRKTL